MHILHTVLYTFPKVLRSRIYLFNNQDLLKLVIISFILVTSMCDSEVIMLGEIIIRCLSCSGIKGLSKPLLSTESSSNVVGKI